MGFQHGKGSILKGPLKCCQVRHLLLLHLLPPLPLPNQFRKVIFASFVNCLLTIMIIDAGKAELESGKVSTPIASENVHAPFGEGDNCCCILSLISGGIISWISECGQFTIDYQRVYC